MSAPADDNPVTSEILAAFEFAAWSKDKLGVPPTNEKLCNPFAITVRLAYVIMLKEKSELVDGWRSASRDGELEAMKDLIDHFDEVIELSEWITWICKQAQVRHMSAASVVAHEGKEAA